MDTLLSVSMSLLGQAANSVPKTPPPPARPPLGNLTNVCATPDSCGTSERRRPGERRRSETLDDTPPTPMTNLKLLTNIAASQPPGTRKTLFAGDTPAEWERAPPQASAAGCQRTGPPVTPHGDENAPPLAVGPLGTPVQHYHSVFDTPVSQDVARAKRAPGSAKLRWRRRASDVLPLTAAAQTLAVPPPPAAVAVTKSRKDKSLSVLCFRFLEIYPLDVGDKEMSLPLDETALILGTERRRIYDIVNVLESLHFSIRLEKNRYAWIGQRDLTATLGRLKGLAIHLEMPQHLQTALLASDGLASPAGVALRRGASEPALSVTASPQLTPRTPCTPCTRTPCTPLSTDTDRLTPHDRGDRTLGVLTQKFVMLLLVSDRPSLSQDVLARVLLGHDGLSPDGHHKAKVRRLYDIANILQSVGLVGKDVSASRRPLFTYTGPSVEPIPVDPATQRSRHSLIPSTPLSSRPAAAPVSGGRRSTNTTTTPRSVTITPRSGAAGTPEGTPRGAVSLWPPASLEDICQVTAQERHRLFEQTIDGSRGKSVLKRRLAEVQRAQAEVKRARPQLSPAQHSQLSGLGIKRILIRAGDGTSQEICVREAAPAGQGDGPGAAGSRLEAALRGAWLTTGPAATPRPQRVLAPRADGSAQQQTQKQVVAYQLVPVVRTVTAATPETAQTPLPILYDEHTFLSLPEGLCLETATMTPVSLTTATPESLLTPGTMTFIREAVSSGTIKTVCNMSLTPETTPREQETNGRLARARPAPRASRRLQMD